MIPRRELLIGKHSVSDADQTIQAQVLETQGMTGIQKYESTNDTVARHFSVEMSIDTIYGPTAVTLQNYVNY